MFWNQTNRPSKLALLLSMVICLFVALEPAKASSGTGHGDWAVVPTSGSAYGLLTDVINVNGRLIAVGAYGTIILSDNGRNWRRASAGGVDVTLTSVFFVDEKNGWAVGHDATILTTRDGGQTWTVQHSKPELEVPLLSLTMTSADRGLAVGAYGMAIETRDGGQTWTDRPLMSGRIEDFHLNGAFRGTGKDLVFVVAESGFVYRSVDRGHSFLQIRTPVTDSFWRGYTLSDGTVWVVGENGRALKSKDLGSSWVEIDTGNEGGVSAVAELSDGRLLMAGAGGFVAIAADPDSKFEPIPAPEEDFTSAVEGPGRFGCANRQARSDSFDWRLGPGGAKSSCFQGIKSESIGAIDRTNRADVRLNSQL